MSTPQPPPPWVDPYEEARRREEEERQRTFAGELPAGGRTRSQCVKLGAWVFGLCVGITLLMLSFGLLVNRGQFSTSETLFSVLVLAVAGIPPAAVLGAFDGYQLFRLATGQKPFREIAWYVWLVVFLALNCLGIFFLPLFFQYRRRKRLLIEGRPDYFLAPVLYFALMVFFVFVAGVELTSNSRRYYPIEWLSWAALTVAASVFLADSLLIRIVAEWRSQGRLFPPPTYKFQFTLGQMMLATLAFSTWVSLLVLMFRELYRSMS